MEVLLRIAANLPDNQSIQRLAAASVSTSAPGYCYDFQKGPSYCKRSKCPYKHEKIPSKSSRSQNTSSDKRNAPKHSNSSASATSSATPTPTPPARPARTPYLAQLTPAQQQIVGPACGSASDMNPQGYSHTQRSIIKAMLTVHAPISLSSVSILDSVSVPVVSEAKPNFSS